MATQLVIMMQAIATQNIQEDADKRKTRLRTGDEIVQFLIYNTIQRCKKHGVKRVDAAVYLHKLLYDETYFDVHDDEERDFKERVFFEPLIVIFDNDKKAMLAAIKKHLERYFPIPGHLNRVWNPVMVLVPFTPKKKSDKRTKRLALRFDWSIKKAD